MPFFYITRKVGQKYKYLKNKKDFEHEAKSIFHHFKGLSLTKIWELFGNCTCQEKLI